MSSPDDYEHFNAFFTRRLKDEARPIAEAENALVCPADGLLSEYGPIEGETLVQAKGHFYSLQQLLGGDAELAKRFEQGHFFTVYLSPRDYHRVHMPMTGELEQTIYIPGKLYSVNLTTTHNIPGIFARNERVVCVFKVQGGWMAQVLVGAINVGSMETVWAGQITPPYGKKQLTIVGEASLHKGDEMGRFNMGSTVVTVFSKGVLKGFQNVTPYQEVQMGEAIGTLQLN